MRNGAPRNLEVYFLSFVSSKYSRSSTILNFTSPALQKRYMHLPAGFVKSVSKLYKNRLELRNADCLVVMSPCHILTPVLKLITRRPVILDAGWSLTDGHISRGLNNLQILKLPIITIIDFISFIFADLILLESRAQVRRVNKFFMIRKKKLRVNFTGLNETSFASKSIESDSINSVKNRIVELKLPTTVLFRGKVNHESGFSSIISAAKSLLDQALFIFVISKKDTDLDFPLNSIVLSEITDDEMKQIYLLSDIAIGQVSSHPRLGYTIPHKAFEAGYFSIAYITSDSKGVREYLKHDSALFLTNPSTESLIKALCELKSPDVRRKYSQNINSNYEKTASQAVLNEKFEAFAFELINSKERRSR